MAALNGLSVRESRGWADWDSLASAWRDLWEQSDPPLPLMLHPDWVRAYADAWERPQGLRWFTVWRGSELTAVLPLVEERCWFRGLRVRRLRGTAGAHSLRFDLVAAGGELGQAAAQQLAMYLLQRGGWDVLQLPDVAAGGAGERLLAALQAQDCPTGVWLSAESPYLDLAADPLARTRPAFRTELRRTRRRLEEQGARLRLVDDSTLPADLPAALHDFYRIEASGWKGKERSAILSQPRSRHFYDQVAAAMAARNRLALYRLEWKGQLLAACFALRARGRFEVIKWAYDESFAAFGPGHLLIEELLRDCRSASLPLRWFSINGPDAAYKRKWTRTTLPLSYLFAFAPGRKGTWLHRAKFVWTPGLQSLAGRLLRRP